MKALLKPLLVALVSGGWIATHGVPVLAQDSDGGQSPRQASSAAQESKPAVQEMTPAQQLNYWFTRAAEAYAAEDHEKWVAALENLHRMRPFNYDFMRQLVMGYALTDQKSKAFNLMLKMQQQGLAVDWDRIEAVESLRPYPLYKHLRDLMKSAGEPDGSVETFATVGRDHPMPEALAHDATTGRLFAGTVRDGKILVRGAGDDAFEVFADPESVDGLRSVFDLLVDEQRGHLWVATGGTSQFVDARRSSFGRTSLIKLDLETGEKLGEYRVLPDGRSHLLGAMTQADDGTIYATDTAAPFVYRLRPGDERPQPIIGNPVFTGLRGIALSPDESRLYLADYDLGVFFFELETGEGYALGIPETLNLGGIDGLYQWKDSLVAIQNGVTPQRVLRLDLDESGTRVAQVAILARALEAFDNPTYGTVAGDDLLFFANSHWHRVDRSGRPVDPPLPDVTVLKSSIDEASKVVVGEEALKKLQQQQRQRAREGDG
ncbi:MAG: hypothetical protein RQ847_08060 [Wenzhouxiangellaceae bacterium]|nr:hypothetical protein [Wenzhouxiangellaceae bacterium]